MSTRTKCSTAAVLCATLALGCAQSSETWAQAVNGKSCSQARQTTGSILGGLIVGLAANQLTKNSDSEVRAAATAAGVLGGGFLGAKALCALSKEDQDRAIQSTQSTARTGFPTNWSNPQTGATGGAVVSGMRKVDTSLSVPVIKERVTQIPPLELVDENYQAIANLNLRQSANEKAPIVGKLANGQIVPVTGRVQGQPWLMIAQDGVGIGFVQADRMKPTRLPVTAAAGSVAGTVEQRTVAISRNCRTVSQTVSLNGQTTSEDVTACQGPNGWEIG